MTRLLPSIVVAVLGLGATIITAWRAHGPPGLSLDALPGNVGVPLRWWNETSALASTPGSRHLSRIQAFLVLGFFVASIASLGWLRGSALVILSQVAAAVVAGKTRDHESQIGPALQRVAAQARANAHRLRLAGDLERAAGAEDLALRVDRFQAAYAHLSPEEFGDFTPPGEVANMLQSFFLADDVLDDADLDLPRWLAAGVRSYSPHPREQARVALLERVRLELVAGGGTDFADPERIKQLVTELRAAEW